MPPRRNRTLPVFIIAATCTMSFVVPGCLERTDQGQGATPSKQPPVNQPVERSKIRNRRKRRTFRRFLTRRPQQRNRPPWNRANRHPPNRRMKSIYNPDLTETGNGQSRWKTNLHRQPRDGLHDWPGRYDPGDGPVTLARTGRRSSQ